MCGASDQCRLAPLVRAGVWEHFHTFGEYEGEIIGDIENDGLTVDTLARIVNKFGVAARLPQQRRNDYTLAILDTANQCNAQSLDIKAASVSQFSSRMSEIGVTIHGVQLSMASKVFWFVSPDGWTMYDRVARVGLGEKNYNSFYNRLNNLCFPKLCDEIRFAANNVLPTRNSPERIVDKMLWILGSGKAGKLCREAEAKLGQQEPLSQLANQITPIICCSLLGKHLLQRLDDMCPTP
ncbi:MAG: hypothetical protein JJU08_11805 [Rhodobacteraceae bacterium]|nr:hypothetical protein [Paracoccaceae bacterium]